MIKYDLGIRGCSRTFKYLIIMYICLQRRFCYNKSKSNLKQILHTLYHNENSNVYKIASSSLLFHILNGVGGGVQSIVSSISSIILYLSPLFSIRLMYFFFFQTLRCPRSTFSLVFRAFF